MEDIATAAVRLNNDRMMPLVGLGSWNANGPELYDAIQLALATGYRHFDTARIYENEPTIGRAIGDFLASDVGTTVQRSSLFITSKLWNTAHRPDLVRDACLQSLRRLRLDYLDMYLMHWPMAFREPSGAGHEEPLWPRDEHQELVASDVDFVHTWGAMEQLVDEGLVRAIGVSNFNTAQLDRLLLTGPRHMPACIQLECHPYLTQSELCKYCAARGIQVVAVSPLGAPNRPNSMTGEPQLFADDSLLAVAKRIGRTAAQVLIRYQLQRGHCAVVKAVQPKHIEANAEVFGFELSEEDMVQLAGLNYGRRFVPFLGCVDFKEYPFKV